MTEGMLPTLAQTRQLHRSLTQKILDKAASDPQWKQQLIDDPEAAMRTANFPELKRVEELRQSAEVAGHVLTNPYNVMTDPYRYTSLQQGYCCAFYTLAQTRLV